MEWVLRSPQIHSTFGNLGFIHADGYHVNENCNAALETILDNILTEDKYLRTYRRSISFGQNIKKDLIPILVHVKEHKTIELLIRILVNLTIPIECLLSLDVISKTDFGRHTIFEINNLLASAKVAFTDHRATKVIIEFLKKNIDLDQQTKLSPEQCTNISNSLLLLRNILHIPDDSAGLGLSPGHSGSGSGHTLQNQILWNIFSQGVDKLLIRLMTIPEAGNWAVTMVQLIALLYKDQHVVTLHKLLNMWLEASLSESSEDNESNTSPDRGNEDSSPMLTSDPTSDSSDTGASGKSNDDPNSENNGWGASSENNTSENVSQPFQTPLSKVNDTDLGEKISVDNVNDDVKSRKDNQMSCSSSGIQMSCSSSDNQMSCSSSDNQQYSEKSNREQSNNCEKKTVKSETSDCGYGTQIENQESISTSSNEDELPRKKPSHQKPHNPKQRINNKIRPGVSLQERKRKKIVKRGKANIINVQGLSHKTPTDDDISNVLKEFTVDFLVKGYNSLVQTLHSQILTNVQLEIDTSHFFWLVTYFLKFATQIELDLEHVSSVLSFDIVSYLTAEGVNLCEQFELAVKLDGNYLIPCVRRLHLVVTAVREFVQAIEVYKKFSHMCNEDQEKLAKLQIKMCETDELRSLLVLLLRHYNPKHHSKQYLQDLIVTNHILLMFVDSVMKLPDYSGTTDMLEHIKQFATPEIMYQYGLLLEDYAGNGDFVNDCIFTLMHHVGGELGSLISLFQPNILKTFTSIWKSEFEICDDWSDLIEYVINTFIKKPHSLQSTTNFRLDSESFDDEKIFTKPDTAPAIQSKQDVIEVENKKRSAHSTTSNSSKERWSDDELSSLTWNYMQCNTLPDVIGEIVKLFKEDGIAKSRDSVIRELFKQKVINKDDFEKLLKGENDRNTNTIQMNKEMRDDEIKKLCELLIQDGKLKFLDWAQKVLLETCFAKIYLEKKSVNCENDQNDPSSVCDVDMLKFEMFKKPNDLPVMSPVSYHALLLNQSVPLVPWNCEQAAICKDLKFLQLLHKLGFHMPVDSGKVFIRIPNFWTIDYLYEMAGKILPIDTEKLMCSINDISDTSATSVSIVTHFYQIHKQKHLATMVNFTPMPGSSFNSENDLKHNGNNKRNWLQVMQQSQEYKIPLNIASPATENEDMKSDHGIGVDKTDVPPPTVGLLMPSTMTAKQEAGSVFTIHISESEDNNSVCETASVASDLTRMYVSDEDEKPELLLRPVMEISPISVGQTSGDSDSGNTGKRPRVQYSPIF